MDVLDADKLVSAVTQASKNLNLHCISPHQASRRRPERRNSVLIRKGDIQLGEDRHSGCMRTGHLDGERAFYLVFRCCGFDQCERSIHGDFGNSAPR
jgi:hypothetical protein